MLSIPRPVLFFDYMDIVLNISNLTGDIGAKYLQEMGDADPIPPKGTLIQSLNEANARLTAILGRFVELTYQEYADDSLAVGDCYVYKLLLSSRRASGKIQAITDLMHSYLVNAVLSKIYAISGHTEVAEMHEKMSVSDAGVITQMLHSKIPPML